MSRPPITYHVSLADLVLVADAACELDGMRMFYADRPDEQDRIACLVAALHDTVERAAARDAGLIYAPGDEVAA